MRFKKGSKEAKDYMSKIRAKRATKSRIKPKTSRVDDLLLLDEIKRNSKKVGATLLIEQGENKKTKPTRVIKRIRSSAGTFKSFKSVGNVNNVMSVIKDIEKTTTMLEMWKTAPIDKVNHNRLKFVAKNVVEKRWFVKHYSKQLSLLKKLLAEQRKSSNKK
jgi:hypothetical protein